MSCPEPHGGTCGGASSSHFSAAQLLGRLLRAQQGEQMRRIGVLMPINANDAEAQARIGAFVAGLQQLGWTVGTAEMMSASVHAILGLNN